MVTHLYWQRLYLLLGLDLVFLPCYDFRLSLCAVILLLHFVEQHYLGATAT